MGGFINPPSSGGGAYSQAQHITDHLALATAGSDSAAHLLEHSHLSTSLYRLVGGRLLAYGDELLLCSDVINSTTDSRFDSPADYLTGTSNDRMVFVRNSSRTGNTSADLVARFNTDVAPYQPNIVMVMIGYNDFKNGVADSVYRANIRTLTALIKSIGAVPYFLTTTPVNSFSAAAAMRITRNNIWLQRYCSFNGIAFYDVYAAVADPAADGQWLSGYAAADGFSLASSITYIGGLLGTLFSQTVIPKQVTPSYSSTDPTNLVTNGNFLNGTTVATGFTSASSLTEGTASYSVISDPSYVGGKAQQITLTSALDGYASVSQGITVPGGSVLAASCTMNTVSGGSLCKGVMSVVCASPSGGLTVSSSRSPSSRSRFYREFTVPSDATSVNVVLSLVSSNTSVYQNLAVSFGNLTVRNLSNLGGSSGNDGGSILIP